MVVNLIPALNLHEFGRKILLFGLVAVLFVSLFVILRQRWREATIRGSLSIYQKQLLIIIILLFVGAIAYRYLRYGHLEQTAALFIGLPTLLSAIVVLAPKSESATNLMLKGISIALLMSGIILGEGFICILMSSPLFLTIGMIIGWVIDRSRKNKTKIQCAVFLAFVMMSFEGVHPWLSFNRHETVVVEKRVLASEQEIFSQLARQAQFPKLLPFYLRLGFPRPVASHGEGLAVGDYREIRFAGGEGRPGNLRLRVVKSEKQRVLFEAERDTSHIAHWLDWKRSIVEMESLSSGESLVRWTIEYDRQLDPAWYFAPWQRYAVSLAAEYLIDTIASPRQ